MVAANLIIDVTIRYSNMRKDLRYLNYTDFAIWKLSIYEASNMHLKSFKIILPIALIISLTLWILFY